MAPRHTRTHSQDSTRAPGIYFPERDSSPYRLRRSSPRVQWGEGSEADGAADVQGRPLSLNAFCRVRSLPNHLDSQRVINADSTIGRVVALLNLNEYLGLMLLYPLNHLEHGDGIGGKGGNLNGTLATTERHPLHIIGRVKQKIVLTFSIPIIDNLTWIIFAGSVGGLCTPILSSAFPPHHLLGDRPVKLSATERGAVRGHGRCSCSTRSDGAFPTHKPKRHPLRVSRATQHHFAVVFIRALPGFLMAATQTSSTPPESAPPSCLCEIGCATSPQSDALTTQRGAPAATTPRIPA